MDFNQAINAIKDVLSKQNIDINYDLYDGLIVKILKSSNTLDLGRTTNQTHIAITGQQMDIFPTIENVGYLSSEVPDLGLKKYFIGKIDVYLSENNIKYLSSDINFNEDDEFIKSDTMVLKSVRSGQSKQIQLSILDKDDQKFIKFRRLLHENYIIIILKRKESLEYEFYGIKPEEYNENIKIMNNKLYHLNTSTIVNISRSLVNDNFDKTERIQNNFELIDLENSYKEYLISIKKLSEGTIPIYTRVLKSNILKKISDYDSKINIYNIADLNTFLEVKSVITNSNNFKEVNNEVYNRAINASLICYEDFLKYRNKIDHQRIFFGAPGTGKSYELNKEAKEYFGNNYERVTFHPNYMYGNFVGAFKPFPKVFKNSDGTIKKDEDGNIQESITYEYIPGVLMRQLVRALKCPTQDYLLLIEEINRANVAAVFGDVFQLLDRDGSGESEYFIATSKELQEFLKKEFDDCNLEKNIKEKLGEDFGRLYLPNNLYIWATMNSADQGVMPMDTAFRRRWEFRYLGIDDAAELNKEDFKRYKFKINSSEVVNWDLFRRELNKKLSSLNIPEDKLIGPYFVSKAILEDSDLDRLTETIKNKVLMYLYEDAAKAYRSSLFAEGKYATYSSVCKHFDDNALSLFKGNIEIKTQPIETNQAYDCRETDEVDIVAEDGVENES